MESLFEKIANIIRPVYEPLEECPDCGAYHEGLCQEAKRELDYDNQREIQLDREDDIRRNNEDFNHEFNHFSND